MSLTNNTIIRDKLHVSALLNRLFKQKCILNIKILSNNGSYITIGNSELLKINYKENSILLDDFEYKIEIGTNITVFTKHKGVETYFQTTVNNQLNNEAANYYICSIPEEVNHKQRRQQYRAEVQNLWTIPVTLVDDTTETPLSAYLYNISTGGINIRSSSSSFKKIKKDTIVNTHIQFPNNENVKCKLLVRQADLNKKAGVQQLAGKFINLDAKQEKTIQSFVNSVDRKIIKNKHELEISSN